MAQLTAEQIQSTVDACRAHLAEIAETFRTGLDCDLRLIAGDPRPFADDTLAPFAAPGLAVSLFLGEQAIVVLIPEPVPLPAWYREPDTSQDNRLQTFAHELSLQLLPADLQADRFSALFAPNLREFVERSSVDPTAAVLDLRVFAADAGETDPPVADILVIVPAHVGPTAIEDAAPRESDFEEASATLPQSNSDEPNYEDVEPTQTSEPVSAATGLTLDQALRALRILDVPVTVSVRLAERKMPLGQIVALVPGALVTFNKSCEDLLDLYVNNHRYSQGEAIKIGEHFGLKIAKIAVTDERKDHIG
jgi:flagellar motor switch protein FliN/FliY